MFPPKVLRGRFGRGEQQVRLGIDSATILLFRPRVSDIVAAQASLDMSERYASGDRCQRSGERAGGVALHDDQVRPSLQERKQCVEDMLDMPMRLNLARRTQVEGWKAVEPATCEIERRMLSGQDYRGRDSPPGKRFGDWPQFDGFRAGSNDQPNVRAVQPSP